MEDQNILLDHMLELVILLKMKTKLDISKRFKNRRDIIKIIKMDR